MEGLDLGGAFFRLALNAEGAALGLNSFASKVTGTVTKVAPQFKGIDDRINSAGASMGNFIRTTERFSRGLRGISPEMASARENVYRLEDGQKRLSDNMEVARMRLVERKAAEIANTEAVQRHRLAIEAENVSLEKITQHLADAKIRLLELKNGTVEHTNALAGQERTYKSADIALEIHQQKMSMMRAKVEALIGDTKTYTLDLQEQAQRSALAKQRAEELTASLVTQEHALDGLILAQKGAAHEEAALGAETERLKASSDLFGAQALKAALDFQKLSERNIGAEYSKANIALRELEISQKQAAVTAGQEAQALSTLSRTVSNTSAQYRDQRLIAQAAYQENQRAIQQIEIQKAKIQQLGLDQKNYSVILQEQGAKRDLLAAKAAEESARYDDHINKIDQLAHKNAGLTSEISRKEAALRTAQAAEKLAITTAEQEVVAYDRLDRAQQSSIHEINLRRAELEKLELDEQKLITTLNKERSTLDQLRASGGASVKDIQAQERVVAGLASKYDDSTEAIQRSNRMMTEAETRQARLARETQTTANEIDRMGQAERRAGAEMEAAGVRETTAAERTERRKAKLQAIQEKIEKVTSSESALGRMLNWVSGLFGRSSAPVDKLAQSENKMISITVALNQRMMTLGSTLRQIFIGGITGALSNGITNLLGGFKMMGGSALESYKSFETLGLSLNALAARELVASGAFKNLTEAQGAAAKVGKETIEWMEQLALLSPFSKDDITGAFRLGQALGFTSSQTKRLIAASVDWASATGANGEAITSVTRAMGQMHNTGHVTLEDLNQLTDAGLSARDVLRREFAPEIKASKKSLEDLISDGVLPADRAIQAMTVSMETDFKGGAKNAAGSMTGLLNSIVDLKNSALREFFTNTFQTIQPLIDRFVSVLNDGSTIETIRHLGEVLGTNLGTVLNLIGEYVLPTVISGFGMFVAVVVESFTFISLLSRRAYDWGYAIGDQLSLGLSDTIDAIVSTIAWIGETIAYWMEPHSPPKFLPNIDKWGKKTAETYLSGWGQADFSLLDDMSGQVKEILDGMVVTGDLSEKGVIPLILGTKDAMKDAIDEIRTVGKVSEATFKRIRESAGPAGGDVEQYARSVFAAEAANRALEAAQKKLSDITAKYDAQLDPLRKKLAALQNKGDGGEREKERARLKAMLAVEAPAGLGPDKKKVQARLDEMALEDRIAGIEAEKAAAEEAASKKVDAAKVAADAANAELEWRTSLLEQQKEQNALVREQIELMKEKKEDEVQAATENTAAEKRAAVEEQQHAAAEYKAKLAAADTEEEKLRIMQEEQAKYKEGSTEYLKAQADIEAQKDRVTAAQERANKEQDKAELATKKLSDAEFEAALAAEDRKGKIEMLRERLGGLTEGTMEYEKTLKRLNGLEQQESSGGGGKKKTKPGMSGDSPFKGIEGAIEPIKKVTNAFANVSLSVDKATARFGIFKDKVQPILDWLTKNSGFVIFVLQKLALSFATALVIEKLVKPILRVVWGFRTLLTWGNAVWMLITFLGYAWKNNLGGLQEIVASVWSKIQAPLENIKNIFTAIVGAFQKDGLGAAWEKIQDEFGNLKQNIGQLGSTVWAGVVEWTAPLIKFLTEMFDKVGSWSENGGIENLVVRIGEAIAKFFTDENGLNRFIGTGILGLIGGLGMVISSLVKGIGLLLLEAWPGLADSVAEGWNKIGEWFHKYGFLIFPVIQTALIGLVAALGEVLVPAIVWLGKRIVDIASWLLPLIPDLIAGLLNTITLLVSWLLGRGVALVLGGLWDLLAYAFQKAGEILPDLGMNLGKAIGSVISTLFVGLIGILGGLLGSLYISVIDGSMLSRMEAMAAGLETFITGLFKGLIGLVVGLLLGLVEPIVNVGRALILGLGDGWTGGIADFFTALVTGFDRVVAWFQDSPITLFTNAGSMISEAFVNGFTALGGLMVIAGGKFLSEILALFDLKLSDVVNLLADFIVVMVLKWTSLKATVLELTQALWDGLVGATGWFVKLLAMGSQLFTDLWNAITGQSGSMTKLKADALAIVQHLWDGLVGANGWFTQIKEMGTKLFQDLYNLVASPAGLLETFKTSSISTFQSLWEQLVGENGILASMMKKVYYYFLGGSLDSFNGIVTSAWAMINANISSTWDAIATNIDNGIKNARNVMIDGLNSMIDAANAAIDAMNAVASVVGIPKIGHISRIQRYALGTQMAGGGIAIVGEDGPEVVNLPRGSAVGTASRTEDMFARQANTITERVNAAIDRAIQGFAGAVETMGRNSEARMVQAMQSSTLAPVSQNTVTNNNVTTHEQHDHWHMVVNSKAEAATVVQDYNTMRLLRGR